MGRHGHLEKQKIEIVAWFARPTRSSRFGQKEGFRWLREISATGKGAGLLGSPPISPHKAMPPRPFRFQQNIPVCDAWFFLLRV